MSWLKSLIFSPLMAAILKPSGIVYPCETQELLRGFENVTRASKHIRMSSEWVKYQF